MFFAHTPGELAGRQSILDPEPAVGGEREIARPLQFPYIVADIKVVAPVRCLVPGRGRVIHANESKPQDIWDKHYTVAPARRR